MICVWEVISFYGFRGKKVGRKERKEKVGKRKEKERKKRKEERERRKKVEKRNGEKVEKKKYERENIGFKLRFCNQNSFSEIFFLLGQSLGFGVKPKF